MLKTLPDSAPVPRDLESREGFVARFLDHPPVKKLTPFKKNKMADAAWAQAKMRSRVSVKNSAGEWLMFD